MLEPIIARVLGRQQLRRGDQLGVTTSRANLHLFAAEGDSCRFTHPAA